MVQALFVASLEAEVLALAEYFDWASIELEAWRDQNGSRRFRASIMIGPVECDRELSAEACTPTLAILALYEKMQELKAGEHKA